MKLEQGTLRIVLVTNNNAYKIPILNNGIKSFLKGWISNIQEKEISQEENEPLLCPVTKSYLLGFIIKMPKAEPLDIPHEQFIECINILGDSFKLHPEIWFQDAIQSNFGFLNNTLVKIDYGIALRMRHSHI